MSNKILALCQDVTIMAIFRQILTSFCPELKDLWTNFADIWYTDEVP